MDLCNRPTTSLMAALPHDHGPVPSPPWDGPEKEHDQQDYQQQAEDAAGAVAPVGGVRPRRHGAHEEHQDQNQKEKPHISPPSRLVNIAPWPLLVQELLEIA